MLVALKGGIKPTPNVVSCWIDDELAEYLPLARELQSTNRMTSLQISEAILKLIDAYLRLEPYWLKRNELLRRIPNYITLINRKIVPVYYSAELFNLVHSGAGLFFRELESLRDAIRTDLADVARQGDEYAEILRARWLAIGKEYVIEKKNLIKTLDSGFFILFKPRENVIRDSWTLTPPDDAVPVEIPDEFDIKNLWSWCTVRDKQDHTLKVVQWTSRREPERKSQCSSSYDELPLVCLSNDPSCLPRLISEELSMPLKTANL